MKKLTVILFTILCYACNMPPQPKQQFFKYDVAVCNSIGCNHYDCQNYRQTGNTYQLLDSAGLVINQITVTGGIAIIVTLNKK